MCGRRLTDYPGRYGSFSLGIYNGGGYHAKEKNQNKVLEGRLTLRPLPAALPGLQLSYFGLVGKGNQAAEPHWNAHLGMVSYEDDHPSDDRLQATLQVSF